MTTTTDQPAYLSGVPVRMRRSTYALFDRMHQAKNAETGLRLSKSQMLDIVVNSAAGVLAPKPKPKAKRDG